MLSNITPLAPRLTDRTAVFEAIDVERDYGDRKHGPINGHGAHTIGEWVLLIESELNEAKVALIKGGMHRDGVRAELTQIAALAVAALEQHGLEDPGPGRQI